MLRLEVLQHWVLGSMVGLPLLKVLVELLVARALGTSSQGWTGLLLRLVRRPTRALPRGLGLPVKVGAHLLEQVLVEALLVDFGARVRRVGHLAARQVLVERPCDILRVQLGRSLLADAHLRVDLQQVGGHPRQAGQVCRLLLDAVVLADELGGGAHLDICRLQVPERKLLQHVADRADRLGVSRRSLLVLEARRLAGDLVALPLAP